MAEQARFQAQQYAFAAHIRDPARHPAPAGIEDRRLAIYRELFFNNVAQLLSRTFPVLHRILGTDGWRTLIRDYFATHKARTPLFLEMPREFLHYLEHERGTVAGDPGFLLELAHYEWVELAVSIDEREPELETVDRHGDLLADRPVVTPLVWSLAYRFPVHRLGPDYQPETPPPDPTLLLVFRNLADKVGFMQINAVTARLLALLDDADLTSGQAALEAIAAELAHPAPDTVITGGRQILEDLRRHEIILGTRRPLPQEASA